MGLEEGLDGIITEIKTGSKEGYRVQEHTVGVFLWTTEPQENAWAYHAVFNRLEHIYPEGFFNLIDEIDPEDGSRCRLTLFAPLVDQGTGKGQFRDETFDYEAGEPKSRSVCRFYYAARQAILLFLEFAKA